MGSKCPRGPRCEPLTILWRTEVTRTHTYWHTRTQSRHWLDLCSLRCRLIVSLYKHGCLTVSLTEYMYMISIVMVCSCTELRSCVRVLVAVLGSSSVTVLMVFVDVKQHWTWTYAPAQPTRYRNRTDSVSVCVVLANVVATVHISALLLDMCQLRCDKYPCIRVMYTHT